MSPASSPAQASVSLALPFASAMSKKGNNVHQGLPISLDPSMKEGTEAEAEPQMTGADMCSEWDTNLSRPLSHVEILGLQQQRSGEHRFCKSADLVRICPCDPETV